MRLRKADMNVYEVRYGTVDLRPVWHLAGPGGASLGKPFNCFEDAERVCNLCNDAFSRGLEAGTLIVSHTASCLGACGAAQTDALEARVARLEELINNGGYR